MTWTAEQATQELLQILPLLNRMVGAEVRACLRQRLAGLDAALATTPEVPPHGGHLTVDVALDHQTALRRADRAWIAALLDRLDTSAAC